MAASVTVIAHPAEVNFAPATELEEVVQNLRTILSTAVGTVPLDRDFGVPVDLIDQPMPVAQAKLTAQIVKAVHKYEPRATVKRVTYTGDADGRLVPKLEVEIDVG